MKKRGFTLIELLAVIVILAIIALIATPMIMGVIDKARQGAAEASTLGYVDGIEKYTVLGLIDGTGLSEKVYEITGGKSTELDVIEFKGETPDSGWVAVSSNGLVAAAYLKFNSYSKGIGYTADDGAKVVTGDAVAKPDSVDKAEQSITSAWGD